MQLMTEVQLLQHQKAFKELIAATENKKKQIEPNLRKDGI